MHNVDSPVPYDGERFLSLMVRLGGPGPMDGKEENLVTSLFPLMPR